MIPLAPNLKCRDQSKNSKKHALHLSTYPSIVISAFIAGETMDGGVECRQSRLACSAAEVGYRYTTRLFVKSKVMEVFLRSLTVMAFYGSEGR